MEVQLINDELLEALQKQASESEKKRISFDLRTSPEDDSQRMLNVLEVGTKVPIHRHLDTTESVVCLEGCLDWVFYQELPNMDAGGPIHDGEKAFDESCFKEIARFRICPREGQYGIQVPAYVWHTIEVHEPSVILEAKNGKFIEEPFKIK